MFFYEMFLNERKKLYKYHTLFMENRKIVKNQSKIIKQQQEEIIHMRKIINILQEDPFETESKINFEPSLNVLIQNKSKALVIKAPPIK